MNSTPVSEKWFQLPLDLTPVGEKTPYAKTPASETSARKYKSQKYCIPEEPDSDPNSSDSLSSDSDSSGDSNYKLRRYDKNKMHWKLNT